MIKLKPLLASLVISLGMGGLSALLTQNAMEQYGGLRQPPLSPPGWLFPAVWFVLFVLMGVAAYLVWMRDSTGRNGALILYGALSTAERGTRGFWNLALTGYVQWMIVNLCDLIFLDIWLIQRKAKHRFVIPGTEGHPGYGFGPWMKQYALPEHLLQWPLLICPLAALLQAGLGLLLGGMLP